MASVSRDVGELAQLTYTGRKRVSGTTQPSATIDSTANCASTLDAPLTTDIPASVSGSDVKTPPRRGSRRVGTIAYDSGAAASPEPAVCGDGRVSASPPASASADAAAAAAAVRSPRARIARDDGVVFSALETDAAGTPRWRREYDAIVAMRSARDAPVDSMGCDVCASQSADVTAAAKRFQTLVSLMLSSQTKDPITFAAMARLREAVGEGMDAHALLAKYGAPGGEEALATLLCPVGFYRNKAKFLLTACRSILSDFGGDIPRDLPGLLSLKGVGPKMAHIAMSSAWGVHVGIGVDTHVHRISNRLAWVRTKEPEQTRVALQALLPEDLWPQVNVLLVGFGQTLCAPVRPRCGECALEQVCAYANGRVVSAASTPARSLASPGAATPASSASVYTDAVASSAAPPIPAEPPRQLAADAAVDSADAAAPASPPSARKRRRGRSASSS